MGIEDHTGIVFKGAKVRSTVRVGTSQAEYDALSKELINRAHEIETAKRPDYTVGDADVLKNFKATGAEAKITAEQAWIIFAKKHWDAIRSIMLAPGGSKFSEPPRERFADLLNYLKLGYALYLERERGLTHATGVQGSGADSPDRSTHR